MSHSIAGVRSRDVHVPMTQSRAPLPPSPIFGRELRAALVAMVRRRVPESDVEDVVQATLTEAIASPNAPADGELLRRWVFGIAKHKVIDFYRQRVRERVELPEDVVADIPPPDEEMDLLRWAERHLPEGDEAKKTLSWLVREGEGEKLQAIAEQERLPADRVRQRVSRLRRHFKQHWQREVAVMAALGVLITAALALWIGHRDAREPIVRDDQGPLVPRAEELRKDALDKCASRAWQRCLDELDEAKRLDPAGDARPGIQRARDDAHKALAPTPPPAPEPSVVPSVTLPPVPFDSVAPDPTGPKSFGTPVPTAPLSSARPTPVQKTQNTAPGKKPGAKRAPPSSKPSDSSDSFFKSDPGVTK